MNSDSLQRAQLIAKAASDKKAKDILILEVGNFLPVTDFFVICSGGSAVQVKAIADGVELKLKEQGIVPIRVEGQRGAHWILVDYGDVIVQIFHEEDREFYNLEKLWADAPVHFFED